MVGHGRYTRYNGPGLEPPSEPQRKTGKFADLLYLGNSSYHYIIHQMELALPGGPPNPLM